MTSSRSELQGLSLLLALAVLAALAVSILGRTPTAPIAVAPTAQEIRSVARITPVPSVLPGPLDGILTPYRKAMRRPIAIVVDNFYPDARPQMGLGAASLVFEAPVESGITRLMAIYLEHDSASVGPIRSARPYFVSWAAGFRSLFVHAGGAPSALQLLARTPQVADIEALQSRPEFVRLKDRPAPHDLVAGTAGIRALAQRTGEDRPVSFTWQPYKVAASPATRGKRRTIRIDFSTRTISSPPGYAVSYRYLPGRNAYLRSQGGSPFRDATTHQQVAVRNLIVLFVREAPIANDPLQRVSVQTVGHGNAWFFRDGRVMHGIWSKGRSGDSLKLLDQHGAMFPLDRGTTWVEALPVGNVPVLGP